MGTFSGLLATLDPDTRIRGRQFEHFVNTDAVFDLAHEIASAQTPSELMAIWSSYVKHRFEMMAKQAKEFTEVDTENSKPKHWSLYRLRLKPQFFQRS